MSNGDSWQRKIAAGETAIQFNSTHSAHVAASVVYESANNKSASSVTAFDHRVHLEDYFGATKEFKLYHMLEIFPFIHPSKKESKQLGHKVKNRYVVLNSRQKPVLFISEMKVSLCSRWWLRYFVFSLDGTFIMSIDRRNPPSCFTMWPCRKDRETTVYAQADVILHPSLAEEEETAFHVRLGTGDFIGHWKMVENYPGAQQADALPLKHIVFDDLHFPVMKALHVSDDHSPNAPARDYVEVFQGDFSVAKISHRMTQGDKSEFVLPIVNTDTRTVSHLNLKNTDYKAQFPVELHVCDKALILGLLLTELKLGQFMS